MNGRTRRWSAAAIAAIVLASAGALAGRPSLVLASVVAATFAAFAVLDRPPEPTVSVTRSLSTETPRPAERVTVTITVHNEGERVLPDVRIVDGTPAELAVVDGSARLATTLRPDERHTIEYTVRARRGEYEFERATVVVRGVSGQRASTIRVGPETTLRCHRPLDSPPVAGNAARRVGDAPSNEGGSGVEFHSVREYRRGDPIGRIDWNRLARTRTLTTVEFRRQRSVRVVVILDARPAARRARRSEEPDGALLSGYAAERVVAALLDRGHRPGAVTLGDDPRLVEPGAGRVHRHRVARLFEHAVDATPCPVGTELPAEPTGWVSELRGRLPPRAALVVCSPVLDDELAEIVRTLAIGERSVTLVSPDVTAGDSTGQRIAALSRERRLSALRRRGVRPIDWDPDEPLPACVERVVAGWSP